jgi:O-antigen/teichoic acid export membrane protein
MDAEGLTKAACCNARVRLDVIGDRRLPRLDEFDRPLHSMYRVRRLAFNAIVLTIGAYVAQGANVLTYVLAARALGPAVFGPLSGAIGIAILVAGFGDFGINGWAIRELARSPSSIELFKETLTAKLTLAALMAVAWVVISGATLGRSALGMPIMLLAGYLLSLVVAGTLTVPFRASENMSVVSFVGAVEKVVTLCVWLALQSLGRYRPELILPMALVAGGGASVVCAALFIPRGLLAIATPSLRRVVELWQSSYSFGLVGVSAGILRADVAIVSAIAGPHASGIYAAPARITSFLVVIPSSFSAAVFPRIARSSADGTSRRPEVTSAGAMLAVMVLLLGVFAVVAPVVIPVALGPAYLSSVLVFRIYLLVVLINAANQPLLALLQAEGYEHYVGRVMLASAVLGLITIAVGTYVGGAPGAAVGAVLLQLVQVLLFGWKALRRPRPLRATRIVADVADGGFEVQVLPPEVVDDTVHS